MSPRNKYIALKYAPTWQRKGHVAQGADIVTKELPPNLFPGSFSQCRHTQPWKLPTEALQPWRLLATLEEAHLMDGGNLGSAAKAYQYSLARGSSGMQYWEWQNQMKKVHGVGGGLLCSQWKGRTQAWWRGLVVYPRPEVKAIVSHGLRCRGFKGLQEIATTTDEGSSRQSEEVVSRTSITLCLVLVLEELPHCTCRRTSVVLALAIGCRSSRSTVVSITGLVAHPC
jgi:hypothetical protein